MAATVTFTAWDEYTMTSKAVQWPRNWSTIPWQPQVSDQLANGFWKSLTVGGKDAYDGAGKICLVSSWQVFANKLASSMQTAGNCSNLFATKPITIRFSALHYLCNLFHIAKARNLKQPLANTLKNQQFSLPPTDPSLGLYDWDLRFLTSKSNKFAKSV